MKIGILTQPLRSNYGGLLQAWALQRTLFKIGHDVTIINRINDPNHSSIPLWRRSLSFLKNEVYIALGKRKRYLPVSAELIDYAEQNVIKFREKRYKGVSPNIMTDEQLLSYVEGEKFDAYVVGSDQVWRPKYSPNLMTYFLDFVKDNDKVKKIAYAASFGVDDWEFTKSQTCEASELAKLFNLITVRESSAVPLVKNHLGCKATHVLDPTMLVDRTDYIGLVKNTTCPLEESNEELFCYVLDKAPVLSKIIGECSKQTGYKPFFCNYKTPYNRLHNNYEKDECIVPPVEQWIKSFSDAKMVVTDSFHGTVFSIIFNKPFWVIANKERGLTRFTSLLEQFGLADRIITSDPKSIEWDKSISWSSVNHTLQTHKDFSLLVLVKNLKT